MTASVEDVDRLERTNELVDQSVPLEFVTISTPPFSRAADAGL
jgi:hypothetical protein